MLRELSVQNLALIEDARIDLRPGYCAWTGETGAGKSLLLTALGLVLGGKSSPDLVRSGREEARAAAVFEVSDPGLRCEIEAILGGPIDEDQLIVTRRVSATGRGSSHVNGMPVSVATLKALGARLIDIHGQHETRTLLDTEGQRQLLDAFGTLGDKLHAYQTLRTTWMTLRDRRANLIKQAHGRERELALLRFELEELDAVAPTVDEPEELSREAHRLANAEQIRSVAQEGFALLYETDRSAQELMERVARKLAPLADSIPEYADAAADLERLADETREIAYALRRLGQNWEEDPNRLEEVEGRLALYRRLAARFRCEPSELADRRETIAEQLSRMEHEEADLQALDGPIAAAWEELIAAATALSLARLQASQGFTKVVHSQLKALGLSSARLTYTVSSETLDALMGAETIGEFGVDRVEILFAPNPGVEARPLRKIASGGELSRVMLAVKTALAGVDRTPTLVFDEIDTGVGGRLGSVLGRKLAELARHHQVICVTHLPQMASFASHQWIIRKQTERGQTWTTIAPLDETDRVAEIAAMLRGDSAAEGTRQEALSMLMEARSLT